MTTMKTKACPDWAKVLFEGDYQDHHEIALVHFKGQAPYLWVRTGGKDRKIATFSGRVQLRKLAKTILKECAE